MCHFSEWDPTRAAKPPDKRELARKRKKSEEAEIAAKATSDIACQLYVKGIKMRTTEATLVDAFAQFGRVVRVSKRDGKDFAFVVFESAESVQKAISQAEEQGRNCVSVGEIDAAGITVQARVLHRKKGKSAAPK